MGKHKAVTNLGIHLFFITRAGLSQCIFLDLTSIWDRVGAPAETRPRSWVNPPDEHRGAEQGLSLQLPHSMAFVLENMKPCAMHIPRVAPRAAEEPCLQNVLGGLLGKRGKGSNQPPRDLSSSCLNKCFQS